MIPVFARNIDFVSNSDHYGTFSAARDRPFRPAARAYGHRGVIRDIATAWT
jgi:hypothetical protein